MKEPPMSALDLCDSDDRHMTADTSPRVGRESA
jgi:hypothetical protein